jgi:hypothetical protein
MPGFPPAALSASWLTVLRDATLVGIACVAAAIATNAARSKPLPWIQHEPHAVLVPCPETTGEVTQVAVWNVDLESPDTLLLDARPTADVKAAPLPRTGTRVLQVPYDYLEPTPPAALERIAATGAAKVVVVGDGLDPDCGMELAKELSGKGIRNVQYLPGGPAALTSRGAPTVPPAATTGEQP